jgi:hypothetical protein
MNVLVATARSRLLARVRSADLKVTRSVMLDLHGASIIMELLTRQWDKKHDG